MILEDLINLICEEFSLDPSDIDKNTLLENFVSDDFEMQELLNEMADAFEIEINFEPSYDWSIGDLAKAVSDDF